MKQDSWINLKGFVHALRWRHIKHGNKRCIKSVSPYVSQPASQPAIQPGNRSSVQQSPKKYLQIITITTSNSGSICPHWPLLFRADWNKKLNISGPLQINKRKTKQTKLCGVQASHECIQTLNYGPGNV